MSKIAPRQSAVGHIRITTVPHRLSAHFERTIGQEKNDMRKLTAIALLIGLSFWALSPEPSQGSDRVEVRHIVASSFNPLAHVFFEGRDTHTTPLEYARYCLDQGDAEWRHFAKEDALDCKMDTEGDGNKGSATVVTFTYHFAHVSKDKTTLIRITTDQGYTLNAAETFNNVRIIRGTP
jgi:hypothetical protein